MISLGSGYVKNLLTGSHYYYRVQWMGKWRYIAGILPALFFVSLYIPLIIMISAYFCAFSLQTLVASVLLRQIHYHVFKFLSELYIYMYIHCVHCVQVNGKSKFGWAEFRDG